VEELAEQDEATVLPKAFEWFVPEYYSGPGFFQLDNVEVHTETSTPTAQRSWTRIKSVYLE